MITKFARLEFELFTKPSKSDFLRIHQIWVFGKKIDDKEVYIKVKIAQVGTDKIAKCISFHIAEYPLSYPFK